MRLAVIIGVSNYSGDTQNLLACDQDADAMNLLTELDGRFDDKLFIKSKTNSADVKTELSEFIEKYQSVDVEEFLFYFTGHGEFYDGELYFLLSDYEARKRRQSSLSNSEIDELVRSVNPVLYSKIIDACHSGMTYIKSNDAMEMYFKSSTAPFNKIYFFFSSQSDQFSYQSNKISYFTESIIRSVVNSDRPTIRYKDVMSFVADDFDAKGVQTPLFVTQADFVETFANLSDDDKKALSRYQAKHVALPSIDGEAQLPAKIDLVEILKSEATKYCTEQQADETIAFIAKEALTTFEPSKFADLFELQIDEKPDYPPNPASIGKWVEQSKDDTIYFAAPTFGQEEYTRPKQLNALAAFAQMNVLAGKPEQEYETAYRTVVDGFKHTWDSPYKHLSIRFNALLPSVAPEECFVVPIVSRTTIRLFWAFTHYTYTDWDSVKMSGMLGWKTTALPIMDSEQLKALIVEISGEFLDFVEEHLSTKWIGELEAEDSDSNN